MTLSCAKIYDILERARWSPSGDNSQPWQFEILNQGRVRVHLTHKAGNVYEFDRADPVWITAGALVETMSLAASEGQIRVDIIGIQDFKEGRGWVDVSFETDLELAYDDLEKFIEKRSVLRFPFCTKDIDQAVLDDMASALGTDFSLHWYRSPSDKWKIIKLNMMATKIRLSIREAYEVHRQMIDWENDFSEEKMPAKSLGMSLLTQKITKWAMQSWERVSFLGMYLGGTLMPRFELDILPGFFCARHFVITLPRRGALVTPEEWIKLGRAIQRFWLCATKQKLALQPSMAPLMFAKYAYSGSRFTKDVAAINMAEVLRRKVEETTGENISDVLFLGRLGYPKALSSETKEGLQSRSVRRPLMKSIIHK